MRKVMRWLLVVAALAMVATGCGSDKKDAADKASTKATTTTAPSDDHDDEGDDHEVDPEDDPDTDDTDAPMAGSDYCELAEEMASQEDLPTADQLERYSELRPDEIAEPVATAVEALKDVKDPVEFFAVYAEDDIEAAVKQINAAEAEQCGVEHSEEELPAEDPSTKELDPDAARVDVVATDYDFDLPETIEAGPTSFVLTNDGAEGHFMLVFKLADGVDLMDAVNSDDGEGVEGAWGTDIAAPGGEDEEIVNVELEAGNYGAVCFIPGPDGKPHAMSGMAVPFTVA